MFRVARAAFGISIAVLMGSGCGGTHRVSPISLRPPATRVELGLAAAAFQDTTRGPFFPREQLLEAVQVIRRIGREHLATRDVAVSPGPADDLSGLFSIQFALSDSLSPTLCNGLSRQPSGYFDRWMNPPRTGLARFDSVTDAMGGSKAVHVQGMRADRCEVTVYYQQPVNIPGVVREYATLRPGISLSPWHYFRQDGGGAIRIEARDSVWHVRVSVGWGDCMGGCVYRHLWEFRYHRATGRIDLVRESGPPVPSGRGYR